MNNPCAHVRCEITASVPTPPRRQARCTQHRHRLSEESLPNSRDKTAWLLEISNGPVKKVITEAKATGGFANPAQRGGTPYMYNRL